ncbi:glutamine--fructose-6-phosphate transaminase (isomerizing) [Lacticaseibacillus zhaodongensis]|uniref:glutamine--fructose-6-phosphate transaminase (isomerizing) n=1 Tax=Lacticaseibacillus zhaodongensis TaxID=2668065 RepID=UPI0012D2F127|nr:glutamine--fructose-6-phosphate transaminase (isomerizing) [Lacticaseibacillus zhaodongensis]
MCGIVGVVGNVNATKVLLNGLNRLEYRGYDSAGIYVNSQDGKPCLIKRVGRIKNLEAAVPETLSGTQGIGHTRWATNGEPTVANAHPHVSADGRFYLVHNGVLTNAQALRNEYLADVDFASDTDTEVAVQLVARFVAEGQSVKEALRKVMQLVEGSYAFALADKEDPNTIYVAKNKSPLLIAKGDGFNAVGSDALALLDQTNQFIELHDEELVVLTANSINIESIDGTPRERETYTVDVSEGDGELGAYPFHMLKEIDEQPVVMRRLLSAYAKADGSIDMPSELLDAMKQADRLYFVAAGTSYHASLAAAAIFEKMAQVPVSVNFASEFGYHIPLLSKKPFFIFLTQSGETADIRQVLVQVKKRHLPVLTITNVITSTLAREADYALSLHAGPEIAVASTKAYTAQVATCALLAKALGMHKQVAAAADWNLAHDLSLVATAQQTLVDQKETIHKFAKEMFATTRNAFYIGRGSDYFVSLEAALKLKEISYIQAEGFAAGELKHGTIALIEDGTPVVAVISDPVTADHTRSNATEVEARGGKVLHIVTAALEQKGDELVVPDVNPLLAPLVTIVPGQLLAYYASLDRGYDVDRPRNLAKSVTVE